MKMPGILAVIDEKRKGDDDEEEGPPSSGNYSAKEKQNLAGELLDALSAKDKTAVYDAIEAIVMACTE